MFISDFINADIRKSMLEEIGNQYSNLGHKGVERQYLLIKLNLTKSDLGTNDLWRRWLISQIQNPNINDGTISLFRKYLLTQVGISNLNKSTPELMRMFFGDALTQLLPYTSAMWLPSKASGQQFPTLEPRTLPNGVSNVGWTQNVSVDVVLQASDIVAFDTTQANHDVINVNTITNMIANTAGSGTPGFVVIEEDSRFSVLSAYVGAITFGHYSGSALRFTVPKGFFQTLTDAKNFFANKTIRYQLATPIDTLNSPFTNPLIDLKGVVGKNKLDLITIEQGGVSDLGVLSSETTRVRTPLLQSQPGIQFTVKVNNSAFRIRSVIAYTGNTFHSTIYGGSSYIDRTFTIPTGADGYRISFTKVLNTDTITPIEFLQSQTQLELGSTATAYEPYGKANLLLQGFAGTTSSGYVGVLCPNGKTVPFLKFDGTNDLGLASADSSPNPIGQQDFAQLVVFKPDDTNARNWGLTRNTSNLSAQYSLLFNGANELRYYIGGVVTAITVALGTTLQYVIYGRISGRKFLILNGLEINEAVNVTNIISQPNVQFGCSSASADGLTKTNFSKGDIVACAFFYDGDNPLDKAKIVDVCKKFVAKEYGL